jgi:DNA primase
LIVKQATPLTEYIIKYLTKNNDLVTSEKKVQFLNEIKPILKELTAIKLLLLFKKRIAELINLDIEEIDQILDIKKTHTQKTSNKIPNRLPMSAKRKFCLLLILRPDLIEQEDLKFFTSESIDDKLILEIIEVTNNKGKYKSAAIMHFISGRFDGELVKQIQEQLTKFDDEMEMQEEIKALRLNIKKNHFSLTNKNKINETTKKSLDSLSKEEREFIKNIGKL